MMSSGTICPECGGVIGGDPKGARPACQCSTSLEDTAVEAEPPASAAEAPTATLAQPQRTAPASGAKICVVCGKDVTHAKRAKDARGYWCYECHKADLRRERAEKPRARCPQCGRLVPAESITTYHGITLCAQCRIQEEELPNHMKLKYKAKVGETEEEKEKRLQRQKKMLIVLGVIMGLLVIIGFLGKLGVL